MTLEDRIAILQSYGPAVLLPDSDAGTVLHTTNPLRDRISPDLCGKTLTYASAGGEVIYIGLSRTVDCVE